MRAEIFSASQVNDMTNTASENVGVRKKRRVVCFENTLLDLDLSIYEKMVCIVLCAHAGKDRPAFPCVRTIAKEASCSRTKVFEALKTLEERGIITRDNRIFEGRGQTSNLYEVNDVTPRPQSEQGGDENSPSSSAERTGEFASRTGGVRDADALLNVFNKIPLTKQKNNPPLPPPGGPEQGEKGKTPGEKRQDTRQDTETGAKEPKASEAEFFELIRDAYNTALPELPKAERVTASRAGILRRRIEEDAARRRPDWWKRFFGRVREFPWPMGNNPNNWRADFDWLIGEKGMLKILEGGFSRPCNPGEATAAGLEIQKKHTQGGKIDAGAILREARAAQARR
jgi:DNA-binding Lrp family transcriptional regulator